MPHRKTRHRWSVFSPGRIRCGWATRTQTDGKTTIRIRRGTFHAVAQADNPFAPADNGLKDPMQKQNRLQDGEPENGGASANQNDNSILSLLGVTQPQQQPTAQNTEQLASMERFRQLLEENSASAAGTTPTPNDKFFPAPKQTPDPNMTPTVLANPIGSPFTPLSDSIGRPVGLTPLPGIVTPISHPAAAPSWAPKPAPWLSQTPDAFTIPQPRF